MCGRHPVPPARPQGALAPGPLPLLPLLLGGPGVGAGAGAGCQGRLPVRLVRGLPLGPHVLVGGHVVQRDVGVEYAEVEQQACTEHWSHRASGGHEATCGQHGEEGGQGGDGDEDRGGHREQEEVEAAGPQREHAVAEAGVLNCSSHTVS